MLREFLVYFFRDAINQTTKEIFKKIQLNVDSER